MPNTNNDFELSIEWRKTDDSPPEVADTSGDLGIRLDDWCASSHYDSFSQTWVNHALVSMYPMALWLAYYWWRLNFEPYAADMKNVPSYRWKSAHDLPAAGHGFVWPPLRFVSTGDTVSCRLLPSTGSHVPANAQYRFSNFKSYTIPQRQFESVVSEFIKKTVARLDAMGHKDTELHHLWQDVCLERDSSESSLYRILEACLGYDPDEGPEEIITRLMDNVHVAGRQAIIEIAAGFSSEMADSVNSVEEIFELNGQGLDAKFCLKDFSLSAGVDQRRSKPWEEGHRLAASLRDILGLGQKPISNSDLANLFELHESVITSGEVAPLHNMSLGMPSDEEHLKIYLHLKYPTARRFYLSRLVGERLLNVDQPSNWLPATFGSTWRQKYQRAFASEFLCPIANLNERLKQAGPDDDYIIEEVAEEYGMAPVAVKNHLDYNRPRELSFESLYDY